MASPTYLICTRGIGMHVVRSMKLKLYHPPSFVVLCNLDYEKRENFDWETWHKGYSTISQKSFAVLHNVGFIVVFGFVRNWFSRYLISRSILWSCTLSHPILIYIGWPSCLSILELELTMSRVISQSKQAGPTQLQGQISLASSSSNQLRAQLEINVLYEANLSLLIRSGLTRVD